jgi:polysaccharide biosynthesis PFTS motif protein
MRGYSALKSENDLDKLFRILSTISHTKLKASSSRLINRYLSESDLYSYHMQQYLLLQFSSSDFKKQILEYYGKDNASVFIYAMPSEIINILETEGFAIGTKRSILMWYIHCLKSWFKGNALLVLTLFGSVCTFVNYFFSKPKNNVKYLVLPGISKNSIPITEADDSRCLVAWFIDRYLEKKKSNRELPLSEVSEIRHNVAGIEDKQYHGVGIHSVKRVLPHPTLAYSLKFLFNSILVSAQSFVLLFSGRWHTALLMPELIRAKQLDSLPNRHLPVAVYYNNSYNIYKPLWTYLAEKRGVIIGLYFYSTNIELLDGKTNYGWDISTWRNYLVWDNYQSDFLKKNSPVDIKVEVVGPVYFEDSPHACPELPARSIAVFDVQPVRSSYYVQLGSNTEYYVPEIANKFLQDVCKVAKKSNFKVVLKRKRIIGKLIHPKYRNMVNELSTSGSIIEVDANLSPNKIIEKVEGVICMPFTSVALIADNHGIPAIFYDPVKAINLKNLSLSHGLPLLNNPVQLSQWIASLKCNTT